LNNLKQLSTALQLYGADWNQKYPTKVHTCVSALYIWAGGAWNANNPTRMNPWFRWRNNNPLTGVWEFYDPYGLGAGGNWWFANPKYVFEPYVRNMKMWQCPSERKRRPLFHDLTYAQEVQNVPAGEYPQVWVNCCGVTPIAAATCANLTQEVMNVIWACVAPQVFGSYGACLSLPTYGNGGEPEPLKNIGYSYSMMIPPRYSIEGPFNFWEMPTRCGLTNKNPKHNQVQSSQFPWIFDCFNINHNGFEKWTAPHNGGVNYGFLDGHAKWYKISTDPSVLEGPFQELVN